MQRELQRLWRQLDQPNRTMRTLEVETLIDVMKRAGVRKMDGTHVSITGRPGRKQWDVHQIFYNVPVGDNEAEDFGSKHIFFHFREVDDGALVLIDKSASPVVRNLPTCTRAGVILQTSGTCFFNTAVNLLCLGQRLAPLVLKQCFQQVAQLTVSQQNTFYNKPLNFSTCPREFSWLHILRMFYAIICRDSPSQLSFTSLQPGYNIMAETIYTSKIRRRHTSNEGDQEVGAEGGLASEGLDPLLDRLDIAWMVYEHPEWTPKVIHPQVIRRDFEQGLLSFQHQSARYVLDTCSIVFQIRGGGGHALAGIFCDGEPTIIDSASGYHIYVAWPKLSAGQFEKAFMLRYFELNPDSPYMIWRVFIEYAIYVRQD